LPSQVLPNAASDDEVVVRSIPTEKHGTWIAVINTSLHSKQEARISLPKGRITDAVTAASLPVVEGKITLDLYPCQLRTFRVQ
jgi:hypothetical protein